MKNDEATGTYTKQQIFRQNANGIWQTHCFNTGGGVYAKNTVTFQTSGFAYRVVQTQWAGDASCLTPTANVFSSNADFEYQILPESPSNTESIVAATIDDGDITYLNGGVAGANASHSCGFTNWVAGVAKSWFLPGEDCRVSLFFTVQPEQGMIHYTRAKFDYNASPPTFVLGADSFPNQNENTLAPYNTNLFYKL